MWFLYVAIATWKWLILSKIKEHYIFSISSLLSIVPIYMHLFSFVFRLWKKSSTGSYKEKKTKIAIWITRSRTHERKLKSSDWLSHLMSRLWHQGKGRNTTFHTVYTATSDMKTKRFAVSMLYRLVMGLVWCSLLLCTHSCVRNKIWSIRFN